MDERIELLLGLRDVTEELFLSLVELGGLVDALYVGFKGRELLEVVVGGEDTADVDNGSVDRIVTYLMSAMVIDLASPMKEYFP